MFLRFRVARMSLISTYDTVKKFVPAWHLHVNCVCIITCYSAAHKRCRKRERGESIKFIPSVELHSLTR